MPDIIQIDDPFSAHRFLSVPSFPSFNWRRLRVLSEGNHFISMFTDSQKQPHVLLFPRLLTQSWWHNTVSSVLQLDVVIAKVQISQTKILCWSQNKHSDAITAASVRPGWVTFSLHERLFWLAFFSASALDCLFCENVVQAEGLNQIKCNSLKYLSFFFYQGKYI